MSHLLCRSISSSPGTPDISPVTERLVGELTLPALNNNLVTFYVAAKIRTPDLPRTNIDVRTINAAEAYISETFHT